MKLKLLLLLSLISVSSAVYANAFYDITPKGSAIMDTTLPSSVMQLEPRNTQQYNPPVKSVEPEIIKGSGSTIGYPSNRDVVYLENAIKSNPGNLDLYYQLLYACYVENNFDKLYEVFNMINELDKKYNGSVIEGLVSYLNGRVLSNKKDTIALDLLGTIYMDHKKWSDALDVYNKLQAIQPGIKYIRSIGECNVALKNYELAVKDFNYIIKQDPHAYYSRYLKGICLAAQGYSKEAMTEYNFILANQPDNAYAKAGIYELLRKTETTESILRKISPEYKTSSIDAAAYYGLAKALNEVGKTAEAVNIYNLTIEKYPDYGPAYIDLAELYESLGDAAKSQKLLNKAQTLSSIDKDVRAKYNTLVAKSANDPLTEALELMKNGLFDDAISVYDSIKPTTPEVLSGIALCYQYQSKYDEAVSYLNKALALNPQNADIYSSFAFLYINKGDIPRAKNYLEKALSYDANNKRAKSLVKLLKDQEVTKLTDQAFYAFDLQNYDEALRLLNSIIELNPDKSETYYYKGLVYVSMGKNAEAIPNFNKTLAIDPNSTLAHYSLGVAYDSVGNKQEALASYRKFLQKPTGEDEYIKHAALRIKELSGN